MVVQPTYSLTAGLSSVQLRSAVTIALESLDELSFPVDWIDAELIRERGWPGVRDALGAAHNPQEEVRGLRPYRRQGNVRLRDIVYYGVDRMFSSCHLEAWCGR